MSPDSVAPKVFISYSHDSPDHMAKVLELANKLRRDGIDAIVDQYEVAPPEGWPRWMEKQVREADYVLIICTPTYLRRAEGTEQPGIGRGVAWESVLLYQHIYDAQTTNTKFIPVLLEGNDTSHIPAPLRSTTSYSYTNEKSYEEVFRRLSSQPQVTKPELGTLRSLSPREPQKSIFKPWNVPFERNDFFVGRDEVLESLRQELREKKRQVLSGLGGIGKTQTAIEYAYRYQGEYAAIFWVPADSEQSIGTEFIKIARLLNLPSQSLTEQKVIIEAVKRWLDENESWLLIFDNVNDADLVHTFLPKQQQGHVLMTSRMPDFQVFGIVRSREVLVFSAPAASEFILKRTARDRECEDMSAIEELTKELGYFPLAIEQAAAFIAENQTSFSDYLKSYRTRRLELLEQHRPVMGSYKDTVATTWAINFAEIEKTPSSADILRLSAFLSPEMIPLELLEKGGSELSEPLASALQAVLNDPVALDDLLRPLTRYSLIHRNPSTRTYTIHLLVQEVVREEMPPEIQRTWAERTVRAVSASFPEAEFKNWPVCERLLSQSLLCESYMNRYDLESEEGANLLRHVGFYLHQRAQYSIAESLYQHALRIREKKLGREHPDTADSLNKLAWLFTDQARYTEAKPLLEQALKIREKIFGSDDPNTATSLNDLGVMEVHLGNYQNAESLQLRALEIREKVLGPEHHETALSLHNLSRIYSYYTKYSDSEHLARRALKIREKVLGPDNPEVAISLINLANICVEEDKYEEAEQFGQRALVIFEKVLGPEHPSTTNALINLAYGYVKQSRYEEAHLLYRRALEIEERTLGPDHPNIGSLFGLCAGLYYRQGNAQEAETLYKRSLTIANKRTPRHPETAKNMLNLAALYHKQGHYKNAEPLLQSALTIREKTFGFNHPFTVESLTHLLSLYQKWGKTKQANFYRRRLKEATRKKRK